MWSSVLWVYVRCLSPEVCSESWSHKRDFISFWKVGRLTCDVRIMGLSNFLTACACFKVSLLVFADSVFSPHLLLTDIPLEEDV
jgi:hypothetical protein